MTAEKINQAIAVLLSLGFSIRNDCGNYVVFNDTGIFLFTDKFDELVKFGNYMKKEMFDSGAENE